MSESVPDCVFCAIARNQAPASLVYEDDLVLAFMDLYPMRPGHVLVIPRQHAMWLEQLAPALRAHLMEVCHQVILAQKASALPCDGNNLFLNDGPAANQHVPHVHFHVLPRKQGDLQRALWSFATRYLNHFGNSARHRRLQQQAAELRRHLPTRISG